MIPENKFHYLKVQLVILRTLAQFQLTFFICFIVLLIAFSILRISTANSAETPNFMLIFRGLLYAWLVALGIVFVFIVVRLPLIFHNVRILKPFAEQIEQSNFRPITRRDYDSGTRFVFTIVEIIITGDLIRNLVNYPVIVSAMGNDGEQRSKDKHTEHLVAISGFSKPIQIQESSEPSISEYSPVIQQYYAAWLKIFADSEQFNRLIMDPFWSGKIGQHLKTEIATVHLGGTDYLLVVGYSDRTANDYLARLNPEYAPGRHISPDHRLSLPHHQITTTNILDLHYDTSNYNDLKALYVAIWRDFYGHRPWEFKDLVSGAYWLHRAGESIETEIEFSYIPKTKIKVITGYSKKFLVQHIIQLWNDTYEPKNQEDDEPFHFFLP